MPRTSGGPSLSERLLGGLDSPGLRDRLDGERTRILSTILTAGALVSGAMLLLVPLWREYPIASMVGYGLSLLLHLVHLAVLRRGRPLFVARSFTILFFLLVTALVYSFGGVRGVGGFVYPLVVLFAGLTWSAAAALGVAASASGVTLVMASLEATGFRFPVENELTPGSAWAVITAAVTMTGVMLLVALRVIRASSEAALDNERRRRELELGLARAHRMEALGQLAGGLAHDFNNMLTGIISHAELLAMKANDDETARHASLIVEAGGRAASLTHQLLTFSRKRDRVLGPVSLNALVESAIAIVERSVDRRIAVEVDLRARPDRVAGDPAELESALLNLVINGCDAMPEGGMLRIATESSPAPGVVRVRVSDTGAGIPEEHLEHIFEPYFTTKEGGKGTGLGLATVYGTVEEHGGEIEVETTGPGGTTFLVSLPTFEPGFDTPAEALPSDALRATRALRVLVVDDEPSVLEALRSTLVHLGHSVLATGEPLEALDILARRRDEIDLAVVDLVMPTLSGRQVIERIREIAANLPVIVATGYFKEPLDDLFGPGPARVLAKPYLRDDLARLIAEVVSS